ncbi:MAG: GPI mannosyltransferase 1 [Vezdaea aestivalis]|nr:MAG: GPI mannosyltransferase 1 [Vezdaea aestivalis]
MASSTAGVPKTAPLPFPLRRKPLLLLSTLLRLTLLLYGLYQDTHSPLKYTDIDYSVFTSAASLVSRHRSPYDRPTYRYTPLLAWLLYPTALPHLNGLLFHSGKLLFAGADIFAGRAMLAVLARAGVGEGFAARIVAAAWLLNPMVAVISTRGSAEGLLGMLVTGMVWDVLEGRIIYAGVLLGVATHLKIYPVIYSLSIALYLAPQAGSASQSKVDWIRAQVSATRVKFFGAAAVAFVWLNALMYGVYGWDFIEHTFLYHVRRLDHRHNFSPYATLLYQASARAGSVLGTDAEKLQDGGFVLEGGLGEVHRLAFVPQLLLSAVLIPLVLVRGGDSRRLGATMMIQTWAFVAFNKVCTSQYFVWYVCLLPFYLPGSVALRRPVVGVTLLGLWLGGQAIWLNAAYQLEFLGKATFVPELWVASLGFFAVNVGILWLFVLDVAGWEEGGGETSKVKVR